MRNVFLSIWSVRPFARLYACTPVLCRRCSGDVSWLRSLPHRSGPHPHTSQTKKAGACEFLSPLMDVQGVASCCGLFLTGRGRTHTHRKQKKLACVGSWLLSHMC